MIEQRVTITADQKPELTTLIRKLPAILSGRLPDEYGLASGFRARIGYTLLSLIGPNFEQLGRGMQGVDGTKWPPLTKHYLAYGRRFGPNEQKDLRQRAGVVAGANKAPNDKVGLLTPDQLKLWRRTYADRLQWFMTREGDKSAKAHAAAVAWIVVKAAGGKTKLDVYGNRVVQILVDTGYLRASLQPGTLYENGPDANYNRPGEKGGQEQVFDIQEPTRVVVGTNVKYAKYHHSAKSIKRRRRLWPERLPAEWWGQILESAVSGLLQIEQILQRGSLT